MRFEGRIRRSGQHLEHNASQKQASSFPPSVRTGALSAYGGSYTEQIEQLGQKKSNAW